MYSLSHQVNNSNHDHEFTVEFTKNSRGLGFTISTYTGNLNSGNGIQYSQFLNVNALKNYKHILTHVSGVNYLSLSNWYGVLLPSVYSAGVIVKSIVKGSAIDQNGRIHVGDIILSVSTVRNTTEG